MQSRLFPALLAVLLGVPLLGPALLQARSACLGVESVDAYGTLWFYWLVGREFPHIGRILHTDLFFFPYGKDVLADTGANVLDAVAALPFRALLGSVAGYDVFVLACLLAAGWTFALLAREFTRDPVAVGVGAVTFAASPWALHEIAEGRPTQGILLLIPLVLRHAWRTGVRRGIREPITAGVLLALLGYQYWFYAIFSAVALAALAGALAVRARREPEAGTPVAVLGRFAILAGVSLVLASPVALPMLLSVGRGDVPGFLDADRWTLLSTPLFTVRGDPVSLTTWQPLLGRTGAWTQEADGTSWFLPTVYLTSWTAAALALLGVLRPGRLGRGPLLAMAIAVIVVVTGPQLLVGEASVPNVPYIVLVKVFPPLRRLWWPVRAYAWLALLGSLAGTLFLAWLRGSGAAPATGLRALLRPGPRLQVLAAVAVVLGWGQHLRSEGLLPMPTWFPTIPAVYRCLASGPSGALVELPYGFTQAHLFYQTVHGRPILGGMAEGTPILEPAEMRQLRDGNTWLRALIDASRSDGPAPAWEAADRQAVHDLGYRYLLLQKDAFLRTTGPGGRTQGEVTHATRLRRLVHVLPDLAGAPVYEDARAVLYAPWGDPPPCGADDLVRDRGPRGTPRTLDDLRPDGSIR